jgi:hypothetical protein
MRGIKAFREQYPAGKNYLLSPKVMMPYRKKISGIEINFSPIEGLSL